MSTPSPVVAAPQQKFEQIPIALIEPSKDNPRKLFEKEALDELAASISADGLVEPIVVRPKKGGEVGFEIIAGERRYRAAKSLGMAAVPSIVREASDAEARALRMVENIQRADLTMAEECAAVDQLLALMPLEQVCEKLGKSKPWVSKRGSVKDMPVPIRELVKGGALKDLEIAGGLAELHAVDEKRAKDYVKDLELAAKRNETPWFERDDVRDAVRRAKSEKKGRSEAAARAAKTKAKNGGKNPEAEAARKAKEQRSRREAQWAAFKPLADAFTKSLSQAAAAIVGKGGAFWAEGPRANWDPQAAPASVEAADFDWSFRDYSPSQAVELAKKTGLSFKLEIEIGEVTPSEAAAIEKVVGRKVQVSRRHWGGGHRLTGKQLQQAFGKAGQVLKLPTPAPAIGEQIAMFLVDHTKADKAGQIKALDLFKKYQAWVKGKKLEALTLSAFGDALKVAKVEKKRLKTGWHYLGITLKG